MPETLRRHVRTVSGDSIAPRVAVVDDDASVCRSLARLLRASGMHADTYPSAEAYLDAGPHRGLDCLILDIELGGMSGIELCEHLRSAGVQAPVIFLTAHEGPEWRERAERAGCAAFFTKSEAGDVVLAAIDRTVTSARAEHARAESRADAESVPPSASDA